MPRPIPPRQPIADRVSGAILTAPDGRTALCLPTPDGTPPRDLVVRYGVRFLGKPFLSIVPGLIALEYGDFLTGEEAWDFVTKRSNLYPRAEIFGYRNDGRDEMMYVKNLDLAAGIDVLAYADDAATVPLARPTALIVADAYAAADADTDVLPARLLAYLPRLATPAAWLETDS